MSISNSNLLALIHLLSDDHSEVVEAARSRLVELKDQAVPYLTQAASSHEDPKVRVEARAVLERIRLAKIGQQWKGLCLLSDDQLDLEEGSFLLARVPYPDLDPQFYHRRLDDLAERVRPRIQGLATPKGKLAALSRFLFKEEGFRGNWADYFDPQNSYLNRVLDRRLGIPISLSILYLLIAWRLSLPLQGAGIPGHFMVKFEKGRTEFFVDVFHEGRFLSRPECVQFIVEAGYPYQVEFLKPAGPREILARMLRNLILIYVDRQEETLERTLTLFLQSLFPSG